MQAFKDYFLEYYNGDNMMNANAVSVKSGGKSMMRTGRKHENLKRKEYTSKNPHVQNVCNGGAGQIQLTGQQLMNMLGDYGMEFKPGVVNGVGNSGAEIQMFENEEGLQVGILRKKQ